MSNTFFFLSMAEFIVWLIIYMLLFWEKQAMSICMKAENIMTELKDSIKEFCKFGHIYIYAFSGTITVYLLGSVSFKTILFPIKDWGPHIKGVGRGLSSLVATGVELTAKAQYELPTRHALALYGLCRNWHPGRLSQILSARIILW